VLGAAAILSIVTGILFGIVPSLQLSRPDLTTALKEGTRGAGTGRARQFMRSLLVVAEVALAVVLLVGAALFIGSFVTLMRINPGFDPTNVLTLGVTPRIPPGVSRGGPIDNGAAFQDIVDRIATVPGVIHASVISGGMPLGGSMSITTLRLPGQKEPEDDDGISIRRVTTKYHEALRMPLRSGRYFADTDRNGAPNVLILNESAEKKFFKGEKAVGRTVLMNDQEWTVVGVVGDVYQSSLEVEPRTEAYTPLAQSRAAFAELVIRTTGNPYDILPVVKSTVLQVMPDVPIRNVRSMEEIIARRVAQRRLNMLLLGLFGVLGLVISAVGIYGVMAYTVSQRTREIGVRMALGATKSTVIGMVMRQATVLLVLGLAIGVASAWPLSAFAQRFLFKLDTHDPRAFGAALATLAVAALIASAIPARRAASVDPMEALRAE